MKIIEMARRLAELGKMEDAQRAYALAIHENSGVEPAEELEAAAYIFQSGGDYKISYTSFIKLYNNRHFKEDIMPIINEAFYDPNINILRSRYEENCNLLSKYPYIFRKDFPAFEELPVRFYPYDEKGWIPFSVNEDRFGEYVNFNKTVISRNFFKDLEKPILAGDVYSQYELEYLNDNVRKSEDIGMENHIYLHFSNWRVFCSYLQCLNLKELLNDKKIVFLIEDEISRYPFDFKELFGIDYSDFPVQPVKIRDINRLIWHTQLASHNGGDFFNEIFDDHPNLICIPSIIIDKVEDAIMEIRKVLDSVKNSPDALNKLNLLEYTDTLKELLELKICTDKDIFIAIYLKKASNLDKRSRIVPAVFFQPHFYNMLYTLGTDSAGTAVLESEQYDKIRESAIFQGFKYIKTFTPMRRITTSHGATVKFMFGYTINDSKHLVNDALIIRVLNRSFMIDWQDRLYADSVLVRFEDGKLNPKATFTALAAFLDLPYTESLTYCSLRGERDPESLKGNDLGFSPAAIYRTYDEYINHDEGYFLEYFMRDAYEYYGYDFKYYDRRPVDEKRAMELLQGFSTIDSYICKSWEMVISGAYSLQHDDEKKVKDISEESKNIANKFVEKQLAEIRENRIKITEQLLRSLNFVNKNGQSLHMMPKLRLDPDLLEQPLYR